MQLAGFVPGNPERKTHLLHQAPPTGKVKPVVKLADCFAGRPLYFF